MKIIRSLVAIIRARIALWGCILEGPRVRLRGKPHVTSKGRVRIGDNVSIHSFLHRVQLSAGKGAELTIGEDTFINNGAVLIAREKVQIGKRVQIANLVVVMDCDFHGVDNRHGESPTAPIIVEDDVWLATRCTILKGVRIGRGSVVAAGAVVTKDVPAYTLVGGIPARPIRSIPPPEQEEHTALSAEAAIISVAA